MNRNKFKKELIANCFFIMTVETGYPFSLHDLKAILNSDISIEEFEKWIDEYDEKNNFKKWIDEYDLSALWDSL